MRDPGNDLSKPRDSEIYKKYPVIRDPEPPFQSLTGGQAYSPTGESKIKKSQTWKVKVALFWKLSHSFTLPKDGLCTMWPLVANGLLAHRGYAWKMRVTRENSLNLGVIDIFKWPIQYIWRVICFLLVPWFVILAENVREIERGNKLHNQKSI